MATSVDVPSNAETPHDKTPNEVVDGMANGDKDQAPKIELKPRRPPRPNYAKIHARPLPAEVHPLPAFIPQSPLSLLRIAYVLLKDFFSRPPSHPAHIYTGILSAESRSVHITDPVHIRALWEMGFFGKGTLSRSEPSWLDRERARRIAGSGGTSEEVTRNRREERKLFKLERARLEREQIEEQLKRERGLLEPPNVKDVATEATNEVPEAEESQHPESIEAVNGLAHVFPWANTHESVSVLGNGGPAIVQHLKQSKSESPEEPEPVVSDVPCQDPEKRDLVSQDTIGAREANGHTLETATQIVEKPQVRFEDNQEDSDAEAEKPGALINQEHLQLTLEEAFFLSYGLGVLDIFTSTPSPQQDLPSGRSLSTQDLFTICQTHSTFPVSSPSDIRPDNPFLLHYVVYHHYRSLGWVVRPGVKFSVDFLLYNRGPVFSHAEFAVMIIPEYSREADQPKQSKDWWWLHCINRVQSQVRKSLVVCYVQVPASLKQTPGEAMDIGAVLRQYKVRDFVIRRWLANRSRD